MIRQCAKSLQKITLSGLKVLLNLITISKKNSNEERDEGYFLEVDAQYTELRAT